MMLLAGGLGWLGGHSGFQFTLFQPGGGGANFNHCITACPSGLENLTASLVPVCTMIVKKHMFCVVCTRRKKSGGITSVITWCQRLNRKGLSDKPSAVGFCLGSGLFGSYNSD